jgi:hypothetical protein
VLEDLTQPVELGALVDTEHRAHDHLEGHRLHARPELERLPVRPAVDLALRDLAHNLAVALHALPVEGRQEQLALAHVRSLVEQQYRVVAEDRLQHHVGLAGMEHARVAREHLPHVVGVGDHHPAALLGDAQRERVSVALAAALEEGADARHPADGLQHAWVARPGRERCHQTAALVVGMCGAT